MWAGGCGYPCRGKETFHGLAEKLGTTTLNIHALVPDSEEQLERVVGLAWVDGWQLAGKLGTTLNIHAPVPGFEDQLERLLNMTCTALQVGPGVQQALAWTHRNHDHPDHHPHPDPHPKPHPHPHLTRWDYTTDARLSGRPSEWGGGGGQGRVEGG